MKLLILISTLTYLVAAADQTHMVKMLDDMATYFNETQFDRAYLSKLNDCMAKDNDDLLLKSQEAAWEGMIDYWNTNGTDHDYNNKSDHWGSKESDLMRNTSGLFGDEKMIIYEPCNYVSNVAYYHSATRVCDYP